MHVKTRKAKGGRKAKARMLNICSVASARSTASSGIAIPISDRAHMNLARCFYSVLV